MNVKDLKVGCQTFTWEMLGDRFAGGPDDLLKAIADGGYSGIEITDTMIGRYADRPSEFAAALKSSGLTLVSFAFGSNSGFTLKEEIGADLEAGEAPHAVEHLVGDVSAVDGVDHHRAGFPVDRDDGAAIGLQVRRGERRHVRSRRSHFDHGRQNGNGHRQRHRRGNAGQPLQHT